MKWQSIGIFGFTVAGLLLAFSSTGLAQHGSKCDGELEPVLDVADFDGNGVVDGQDVKLVTQAVNSGKYVAFYDRNADEKLDHRDIRATARQTGTESPKVDQQIASVFWATESYRNLQNAMQAGFIPFTQAFHGHGVHWANPYDGRFDKNFQPAVPEGLNYSKDGELLAVFYYYGNFFSSAAPAPEGFAGDEDHWHTHIGSCFGGVDYSDPTYDPSELDYNQCMSPQECYAYTGSTETIWTPKFYMLHLWLYDLNPCGRFAGTHPDAAVGEPDVPNHDAQCPVEDLLP